MAEDFCDDISAQDMGLIEVVDDEGLRMYLSDVRGLLGATL